MRRYLIAFVVGSLFIASKASFAQTDVPASHWSKSMVSTLVSLGVMSAPNGKFSGDAPATRADLAVATAAAARHLEAATWPKAAAKPVGPPSNSVAWRAKVVSRYELASILYKSAAFAAKGLPVKPAKPFVDSLAMPPAVKPTGITKSTGAARTAALYLAQNRMLAPKSVLLAADATAVTGQQVADAVSQMLIGVNARMNGEPQNREDLGKEPPHKH